MRLLFDIPRYLPAKDGAIMMVKDYKEAMEARGHEVKITCLFGQKDGGSELYDWADIVLSHLGRSNHACNQGKPFIWLKHSDQFTMDTPTIYNSHWLAEGRDTVCYPICDYSNFMEQSTGSYITLIGLNPNKGGELLRELAGRMRGHRFIGVCGAYGGQEVHAQPKNVKIIPHPCYIDKILKDTKVLLVMSEYESFSRCTAEAMSMGIPIISTRTRGVLECAEQAPCYIDVRENIEEWIDGIMKVGLNLEHYQKRSRLRGQELRALTKDHITNFETICYENQSTKAVQTA